MPTVNIVPRADNEGSVGTERKKWTGVNAYEVNADTVNADKISAESISVIDIKKEGKNLVTADEIVGANPIRQSNTACAVGDIAYSPLLPSWARLECVKPGITVNAEIVLPSEIHAGLLVVDGTMMWIVDDIRDCAAVGDVTGKLYLPDGYVKANGATVNRADYPRLVNLADKYGLWTDDTVTYPAMFGRGDGSITMALPDWRGVVARYVDDGKGYDAMRELGTYQEDMFKSHAHDYYRHMNNGGGSGPTPNQTLYLTQTSATGGAETRMKNIALIAQIKY